MGLRVVILLQLDYYNELGWIKLSLVMELNESAVDSKNNYVRMNCPLGIKTLLL